MSHPNLPITEVLVVADCWQREPESEAVIQRAVAAAAEKVDEDVAEAEVVIRNEFVARIVSAYEGSPQRPAAGKS